ncbi:MAG: SRPBCC family protein [Pseudomonadota bacterium]
MSQVLRSAARTITTLALCALLYAMPSPVIAGGQNFDARTVTTAPVRSTQSVIVVAPPSAVYDYVSNHQNWVDWFPPFARVDVATDGKGRSFTFVDGKTMLHERIVFAARPKAFAWSFRPGNPFGVTDHVGVLRFTRESVGTRVTLSSHYNHPDPKAVASNFEGGAQAILGAIQKQFSK